MNKSTNKIGLISLEFESRLRLGPIPKLNFLIKLTIWLNLAFLVKKMCVYFIKVYECFTTN